MSDKMSSDLRNRIKELEAQLAELNSPVILSEWQELQAENKALREENGVALAEAYRCGYEAGKTELQEKLDPTPPPEEYDDQDVPF